MRILLDEDLPRRLGEFLIGHEVETVPRSGWAGIKNGKLLALTSTKFDVFVTMDQNLEFQQNLAKLPVVSRFARCHPTAVGRKTEVRCYRGSPLPRHH